jgi:hypothetical protein
MARIRTIKPEFFTSLTIADLPLTARLTFIGLWTHADDEGRCVDEPRLIRAAVWPLDDRTAAEVEDDLHALDDASLIVRYQHAGRRYLAVRSWREHQKIDRPKASKLPALEDGTPVPPTPPQNQDHEPPTSGNEEFADTSANHRETIDDASTTHRGHVAVGKEQGTGKGKEQGKNSPPPSAAEPPPAADAGTAQPPGAETRDDIELICSTLADAIAANGSKRPNITKRWRTEARLLLDKDGRTVDQVLTAIAWCQNDTFWRANVLSMPKLREKYDQLRLAAQRTQQQHPGGNVVPIGHARPSTTDARVQAALDAGRRLQALADAQNAQEAQ